MLYLINEISLSSGSTNDIMQNIIEGGYHHKQYGYDKGREDLLYKIGIKTIRFENDNILNDIDNVFLELDKILEERKKEIM